MPVLPKNWVAKMSAVYRAMKSLDAIDLKYLNERIQAERAREAREATKELLKRNARRTRRKK